jgi:hypothetical protein
VKNAYEISLGIPKRENWRPCRRWKGGIKINIKVVVGGVDWIQLAEDMVKWQVLVNIARNLRPSRSFSSRTLLYRDEIKVKLSQ